MKIIRKKKENFEIFLKRYKKILKNSKILEDLKKRKNYIKLRK
ncbi:30S ribosomal protein S21 [Candidatus Vidania fulgoroideorum]